MLVLGLNQTVDRTISLDRLVPGTVLRTSEVVVTGGGKAVNVARVALVLGHPCLLAGPFPGSMGAMAAELIGAEGITIEPIELVEGQIRGTTIVLEPDRATVINESGPPMIDGAWPDALVTLGALLERLDTEQAARSQRWMVASGSVPPNTPPSVHHDLIELAHQHGWKVAVDVTGAELLAAADKGADLVSPNLAEAKAALEGRNGQEAVEPTGPEVPNEALSAARRLVDRGARSALVSAGSHGVAAATGDEQWFIAAPTIEVVNPIGAGDSLLGATVVGLEQGLPLAQAAIGGVAYAAASVNDPTGGYAKPETYHRLHRELSATSGKPATGSADEADEADRAGSHR